MAITKPSVKKSIKQKKAALLTSNMVANGGNDETTMGEILKESGYSDAIAKNPHKVTQSEGFKQALEDLGTIGSLEKSIKTAFNKIDSKIDKAGYGEVAGAIDKFIKNRQLLKGEPTSREENQFKGMSTEDLEKMLEE